VDPFALTYSVLRGSTCHLQQVVSPNAGCTEDDAGTNVELATGELISNDGPNHSAVLADESNDRGAGGDRRAMCRGSSSDRNRMPGIINLRIVEPHCANERVIFDTWGNAFDDLGRKGLWPGHSTAVRAESAQHVVHGDAESDIRAFPTTSGHGVKERHRADEMWRESIQEETTFGQRFVDEGKLALFQVTQPTVGKATRTARRPAREVMTFDKCD
jgi:hypothetical protein